MLSLFTYIFIQNWDGGAPEKKHIKGDGGALLAVQVLPRF